MKRDIRKQTFSKPAKPSDEEIKKLTADESSLTPNLQTRDTAKAAVKNENISVQKSALGENISSGKQIETSNAKTSNPFLLSRGQTSKLSVEKTGYRLRSDYMDLLKLVKRMKKGHTLEAVLDDALTFYFENSDDGRKAVKQREMLDAE